MWKLLVLSLALIQVIEGRTNEDVINDFEPIFKERDEAFTALKNLTVSSMDPKFKSFDEAVRKQGDLIMFEEYPESVNRMYNAISEYIKTLELENYPELTKGCMEYLNQSIEYTRLAVTGEGRSCTRLTFHQFQLLYKDHYLDLIERFGNEHTALNKVRTDCVRYGTPLEVQSCLIERLYTYYVPYLQEVTTFIEDVIEEWSAELNKYLLNTLSPCVELLKEDMKEFETSNIDGTKICLWSIQKPTLKV